MDEQNADEARAICGRCLCRTEREAYALADPTLLGIWAGTSTAERKKLRRQQGCLTFPSRGQAAK